MGHRPDIPQTKRSIYRPMNQMNGDFLTQLKKPICSELSPDFRGSTRARVAHCRQQVGLWYKDQEFTLRKINRSEDSFYHNLIQVHKEKRKLQRLATKRQQALVRRNSWEGSWHSGLDQTVPTLPNIVSQSLDESAVEVHRELDKTTPPEEDNSQDKEDVVDSSGNLQGAIVGKSKVLEVQKGNKEPRTREVKENTDIPEESTKPKKRVKKRRKSKIKQDSDARTETEDTATKPELSHEQIICKLSTEKMPIHTLPNSKHHRTKMMLTMPAISESENIDKTQNENHEHDAKMAPEAETFAVGSSELPNKFGIVTVMPAPLISSSVDSIFSVKSTKSSKSHTSTHSSNSLSNTTRSSRDRTDSESDAKENKVSLVVLNKRRNKLRDKQRKSILNSERLQLYDRNERGEVVPAVRSFRRKAFTLPSSKETRFRNKLLTELKTLRDSEADRIEKFFNKLDIEKDKTSDRPFRVRPQPAEEEPAVKRDAPSVGLVSLEKIAAVFSRAHLQPLPQGVEPGSIEAMRNCSYLRSYELAPIESEAEDSGCYQEPKIRRSSKPLA